MPEFIQDSNDVLVGDYILKITGGPMRGTEFPVRKSVFTVGRSAESDIHIQDTLTSRIHCKLSLEGKTWYIEDLNSTNGTWLLGQKLTERAVLPIRASVRLGKTIFELYDTYIGDQTGIYQNPSISCSIRPDTLVPSSAKDGSSSKIIREENKRLAAVYKFQNLISSVFEEEELYKKIISAVMNVIPAQEACLLMFDLEKGDFTPKVASTPANPQQDFSELDITKSLISFVKDNHESVLANENPEESGINLRGLAHMPKVKVSKMCVPLLGKQQLIGMLYLKLSSTTEVYTEDDLRLLTVIGHTAGMAIENSKMLEFNLKNERLVATGATAAGLSHYIKNILAGLEGSLSLLRLGIDEKDLSLADESWNILQKNHRRLGNLVLDLLNLASEQKLEFTITNVNLIIRDVVELLQAQFKQQNIILSVDNELINLPMYAEVDPKGIHRVLLNLLTNAEQSILSKRQSLTDETAGHVEVVAKLNATKDYVLVSVTDDGIGIEEEDMKKIFDLFISTKGSAGTGLGLAVCKRIVEAHGGNVSVTSERNKGCTFLFTLPVARNEMTTETCTISRIKNVTI